MRGSADRHHEKRNALTLDNNYFKAEYTKKFVIEW